MESKNGYFKLDIRDGNVYLVVFPPADGGKPVEYKEVTSYLEGKGYAVLDARELNTALTARGEPREVFLGMWNGLDESEQMEVTISIDKMLVFAGFIRLPIMAGL